MNILISQKHNKTDKNTIFEDSVFVCEWGREKEFKE